MAASVCSSCSTLSVANRCHRINNKLETKIPTQYHCHFLSSPTPLTLTITLSKKHQQHKSTFHIVSCLSPSSQQQQNKLYVSGLSFRTTEESLRNAFQSFGELIEVNLVMDKIANRPRGFAFLRYATKEESDKAIEGMHGKFLDGRVIFVEFAKPRSQLNQSAKQDSKPYR
ncbi:nucleotide-binding alpha-beta plait domain-containing protein [Artemisia annua]|uniref:Nucleotide-binding alpha-beta plait domain-containing protein n=1 Tax=Artemisia annua TaxID=35608 RepID=A0A2U1N3A4_ARTAN|nr:nucleotide-binding alpha-beta plait domain-containing protein [Artemisia annua]